MESKWVETNQRISIAIMALLFVVVIVAGFSFLSGAQVQLPRCSHDMVDWAEVRATPVYDLAEINLLNHDLTDSNLLIAHTLTNAHTGTTYNVSVFAAGQARLEEQGRVTWYWTSENELELIGASYTLWSSPYVLDPLDANIEHDILQQYRRCFESSTTVPLRINDDLSAAFFALNFQRPAQNHAITVIYLSQTIPDSDYTVILRLVLPSLIGWSEEATAIIDELSYHIGIDFAAYVP